MIQPGSKTLSEALSAAGEQHHEYQTHYLKGVNDDQWAGWYAAYLLGSLGHFTSPTQLVEWLAEVPVTEDWTKDAAAYIWKRVKEGG